MTINYHNLQEDNLKFVLIALMVAAGDEKAKAIDADSNGFTEIDMRISMNGHDIDSTTFLDRFVDAFAGESEHRARRLLIDEPAIHEIRNAADEINEVMSEVSMVLRNRLMEIPFLKGYDFDEWLHG